MRRVLGLALVLMFLGVGLANAAALGCLTGLTSAERAAMLAAIARSDEATQAPPATLDDETLHAIILRYARSEAGLRVRPGQVDRLWAIEPVERDLLAEYSQARRSATLAGWLASLSSPHQAYRALRAEHCRYAEIVDNGGWSALPPGPELRLGARHPSVAALRARLAVEGYRLAPASDPDLLDAGLADALAAFQLRHDLEPDAVLGPNTRLALDAPAEGRLLQLAMNMERWRWLPHHLPPDRLELDVGAAEAILYSGGQPRLTMRVIVGDPGHKNPMFSSRIEAVVLNPPWRVPVSIARDELLPRAARDPGYLIRNGFRRTPEGALEQRPGPANALGRVKFDLPSPFGVYLHDTPGKAAFARRERTLSHGCMRLEKPRELAAALLAGQGWTRKEIDQAIAAGATRRIELAVPLPLVVVYRTAGVDNAGAAVFRSDPYGWDSKLSAALAGASEAQPPAVDTDCANADGTR